MCVSVCPSADTPIGQTPRAGTVDSKGVRATGGSNSNSRVTGFPILAKLASSGSFRFSFTLDSQKQIESYLRVFSPTWMWSVSPIPPKVPGSGAVVWRCPLVVQKHYHRYGDTRYLPALWVPLNEPHLHLTQLYLSQCVHGNNNFEIPLLQGYFLLGILFSRISSTESNNGLNFFLQAKLWAHSVLIYYKNNDGHF